MNPTTGNGTASHPVASLRPPRAWARAAHVCLAPAVLGLACSTAGGGDDACACVPAECARECLEYGYRVGECVAGICRCSDPHDPDADADAPDDVAEDGAVEEAEVEAEADASEEDGASDVPTCEGFDLDAVPGSYSGTFAGTIHALGEDYPMDGDVTFRVEAGGVTSWTFDGTMSGTAMGGAYGWNSRIQGSLDCERLDGDFYEGVVSVEGTDYHFGGTMQSSFVPYGCPDGTFAGTCTDCPVPVTGDGTWSVTHD
ncbi:MAG: hypothetical protein JXB32_18515 [Deltaproteobacteria bacterium]|nr:hypothetical protein [Deltaproteobacteria bacterium]